MNSKFVTSLLLVAMAGAIGLMFHDGFLLQWTGAMTFILSVIAAVSVNCKNP